MNFRRGVARSALVLAAIGLIAAVASPGEHEENGAFMGLGIEKVMCSEFNGVLLDEHGKPMPGVRIERTWKWSWTGESSRDETVSDSKGRFRFPLVTRRNLLTSILPHQPVIRQEITAYGPNGPVVLWGHAKFDYVVNGELDGRPIRVLCGIETAPPGEVLFRGTCVEAP